MVLALAEVNSKGRVMKTAAASISRWLRVPSKGVTLHGWGEAGASCWARVQSQAALLRAVKRICQELYLHDILIFIEDGVRRFHSWLRKPSKGKV